MTGLTSLVRSNAQHCGTYHNDRHPRLTGGRVAVLAASNPAKHPVGTPSERTIQLRRELPADWDNVSVAWWSGLTVAFCRQHGASVIIRGVRNGSDLVHEYQLSAMNEAMGITTLLLPAQPGLTAESSTVQCGLGARWKSPEGT